MVDKDVLIAKVTNIQNCLARIQRMTDSPDADLFQDMTVQDVVVLNLQRAVQAVIDIAAHVVASERFGVPQSQKDLFSILERECIIESRLGAAMRNMVGFRNIAVHDYSAIDPHILESIITKHLGELEDFYTVVLKHFEVAQ